MLTIAICMIAITVLAVQEMYDGWDSFFGKIMSVFLGCFVGLVFGGFIGVIAATLLGLPIPATTDTRTRTWHLASLRNNDGIQGSFFLGTGSIGQSQYYFFYEEVGNGFRPNKVRVDDGNVIIYEEDRPNADLVISWTEYRHRLIDNFVIHWPELVPGSDPKYTFRIPKGSIKKGYSLN